MPLRSLLATLIVFAATAPVLSASVVDTRFTVTIEKKGEVQTFSEPVFPVRQGVCYYWGLRLKKAGEAEVAVTEEFVLPSQPAVFSSDEDTADSTTVLGTDGRSARRDITVPLVDGWAESGWCVTPGDPLGTHVFNIYEGDNLLHSFEFEGVPPADFEVLHPAQ